MPGPEPGVAVAADVGHHLDVQAALAVEDDAVDRDPVGHAGDVAGVRAAADDPAELDAHSRADPHLERAASHDPPQVISSVPDERLRQARPQRRGRRVLPAQHARGEMPEHLALRVEDGDFDVRRPLHRERNGDLAARSLCGGRPREPDFAGRYGAGRQYGEQAQNRSSRHAQSPHFIRAPSRPPVSYLTSQVASAWRTIRATTTRRLFRSATKTRSPASSTPIGQPYGMAGVGCFDPAPRLSMLP